MFCRDCGASMSESAKFCPECGAVRSPAAVARPPAPSAPPAPPAPPVKATPEYNYQQSAQPAKKKTSGGLIALLVAIPLLLAGGFGAYYFFFRDAGGSADAVSASVGKSASSVTDLSAVSYTYQEKKPEAVIEFITAEEIFPSNYRTLESLATFTGYCDFGEMDVLIEVEVPGFTQAFRQKIRLGRQVTKLRIVPPLVTGTIDLNSEKLAQLVYSVTEVDTGKLLVQESKSLKLYSKFDIIWSDGTYPDANTDNILAWMTPDAPEIVTLKRDAIDYLSYITDGGLQMLIGYQDIGLFDGNVYTNTFAQAVAIQGAMSDIAKVRYNNSRFSMDSQQRVKLPADTLSSRSGICIETALVMASALQSTGMHCMLIFPPGHAQVAVEAWPNTGDYYLIETTVLPMTMNQDAWNSTVMFLDKEQWLGYLSGEGSVTLGQCYVVDCDLGAKLGIRAMSN